VLMYFLDKVVLATIVGLATSAIFLLILSRFRPKIEISSIIARGTGKNGKTAYRVKVINRTRSPITDIKAQLHVFRSSQTATGEITKSVRVNLSQSNPIIIQGYDKHDPRAEYAYRFVTYYDLESKWADDTAQFLRFRIFARHSISGFGAVFYKDYRLRRNSIVDGDFSMGATFDINTTQPHK
jgi:hypothetical protein